MRIGLLEAKHFDKLLGFIAVGEQILKFVLWTFLLQNF